MNYKNFLGAASTALMIVIIATVVLMPGAWAQNKFKTLYKFKGGADGGHLNAPLIFDSAGSLYSTTWGGGAYGAGTVLKLSPNPHGSWTKSVLYSFKGGDDGAGPFARVILDQAGNLYGNTYSGGHYDNGTVFQLSPNGDGTWTENVLYRFQGGYRRRK